jgi:hypothetical protein
MPSRYPIFDLSRLRLRPLAEREHLVDVGELLVPDAGQGGEDFQDPQLEILADAVADALARKAAVVVMFGAHVIKQGLGRYLGEWVRRGWISVLAGNGACTIHDWELARIGATSESVPRYIRSGQFGLWRETGALNEIACEAAAEGLGLGEAVGRAICRENLPNADASVYAAAWRAAVPATVHVGIGYDIIHAHPNFDPAATGAASGRDFLIFARQIENLEGGVVLSLGSAVMGPEVYLKALSMARNVAAAEGRSIRRFTAGVFDLVDLPDDLSREAPKDCPEYFFRPYKTILVRTVADGGQSCYVRGDHRRTLPALHRLLERRLGGDGERGRA